MRAPGPASSPPRRARLAPLPALPLGVRSTIACLSDRQLFDLVAPRLARAHKLPRREEMPAAAALGPMLDYVIDRARRQQLPAVALMTILGALLAAREVLARGARRLPGGSELGGAEELRELLFSSRSSFSTRASNCWIRRSIASSTSTTASRPAS